MPKKKYLMIGTLLKVLVITMVTCNTTFAQNQNDANDYTGSLQVAGIATSDHQVPFWLRTNQYGNNPLDGISSNMNARFYKNYGDTSKHKLWDWGGGSYGRLNMGQDIRFDFIEAYLKVRYSIFQIKAGRTADQMGLADSALSSGSFAVSGNALGIPKVELSIPDYWEVPLTHKLISIKGTFSLGYVGNMEINKSKVSEERDIITYYHQKSFYGKIGKPNWRLNLYGGFNHQVMFGNESIYLGPDYGLSSTQTLLYVVLGRAYGNKSILPSKVGNHIGTIDQAISYDFNSFKIKAYHQFFYDVGGLVHLNNLKDGLWGVSFENKREGKGNIRWNKLLFEVLNSKSQGGEWNAKVTPSGDEDYYNNYIYSKGWSYKGENIGNNFLTNKSYERDGLPTYKNEYFGNNRVFLVHIGADMNWYSWNILSKLSFSKNYGSYATSPIGNSQGKEHYIQPPPYFSEVNQFSGYFEASHVVKKKLNIGFVFAMDHGGLLYNSVGGIVRLTKYW